VLASTLDKVRSLEEGLDELIKRVAELEVKITDAASKLEARTTEAESLLEEMADKQE
jgi:predicted  nucleic acid-binding Zn-ribbon protein